MNLYFQICRIRPHGRFDTRWGAMAQGRDRSGNTGIPGMRARSPHSSDLGVRPRADPGIRLLNEGGIGPVRQEQDPDSNRPPSDAGVPRDRRQHRRKIDIRGPTAIDPNRRASTFTPA